MLNAKKGNEQISVTNNHGEETSTQLHRKMSG